MKSIATFSTDLSLDVNNQRIALSITIATGLGTILALVSPAYWLQYYFLGAGFTALVFGSIAAGSAKPEAAPSSEPVGKILLWLVIGTDHPLAQIKNTAALLIFWVALAFIAGLTLGAFGAVLN